MSSLVYQCCRLTCGILYPTYSSFKAVRSKNVKEYVKWMMYWIVFALFSFLEVFSDLFVSWLPFYYELKIGFVLWLCLPATKGSSVVYRKLVHPQLLKNEGEIDRYIERVRDQSYSALIALGARGFTFATNVVLTTAIKGQTKLADTLQKSFSLTDLSETTDGVDFRASTLSLASTEQDENIENERLREDYQQSIRPRTLLRSADSNVADWKTEEKISTQSVQLTRRFVDGKRVRQQLADRTELTPSPTLSSPSSGFGDELSERGASPLSDSLLSQSTTASVGTATGHNLAPSLFSRFFPAASPNSSVRSPSAPSGYLSTSSSSWRSRSSYNK